MSERQSTRDPRSDGTAQTSDDETAADDDSAATTDDAATASGEETGPADGAGFGRDPSQTAATETPSEETDSADGAADTWESAGPADAGEPRSRESAESIPEEWTNYEVEGQPKISVSDLDVYYGDDHALKDVSIDVPRNSVTALIGPSGCGKSTFLRSLNRMNDRINGARVEGSVELDGTEIYGDGTDLVELRRRVGMVFQSPNPFPKTIRDNVAYGPRKHGDLRTGLLAKLLGRDTRDEEAELVERCLRQAALWDEVSDRLDDNALGLSGGQQQRLCIARCLAVDPEVILMDEPASALDPIATAKIEDLIEELAEDYTVIVVTHNMQQAARISDQTAVFLTGGELVEFDDTGKIFENPESQRVEDYITGKFG